MSPWKVCVSLGVLVMACGGTTDTPDSGAMMPTDDSGAMTADAGMDMPDTGEQDTGVPYPAPFPAPPQVLNSGGPTAGMGIVVPVFFQNDSLQSDAEAFLKQLSPSTYWTATTKEYKVGDFTVLPSVVINGPAPSNIDDSGIQTWLATHADGSDMAWPKADSSTVFAIFYPNGTTITLQGSQSCNGFGGYHSNTSLADNTAFSYAVMPRCGGGIDNLTGVTSHEIVEWATDPFPMGNSAFQMVDFNHLYWAPAGGETGDMCEFGNTYGRLVGNFMVQRTWSNNSIKAGHDPCVPAPTGVYFAAAPESPDQVQYKYYGQAVKTRGVKIPVGMSKTIPVHLYSDGPKAPWTVTATTSFGSQGALTFSFDKTTGQNGDILQLTITSVKATTSGSARFSVTSTDSSMVKHTWYGLVAPQ